MRGVQPNGRETCKASNKTISMCLYPRLIKNPRKDGLIDERQKYVTISCGNCYECRKQKAQAWRVRLQNEIREWKHSYFVTLTFSNESLEKLCTKNKTTENNAIAGAAVRMFLERWRKTHKKTLRHWLITELGHEGTERIHLHGILCTNEELTNETLQRFWQYGRTDTGQYCNERTINYIIKYVTKIDTDHKNYKADIYTSPGIGSAWLNKATAKTYKYKKGESKEYYQLPTGQKVNLPIYYRNKLYTDLERQKMWSDRIDKDKLWVNGIEIRNISSLDSYHEYMNILQAQQKWNKECGYGDTSNEWKEQPYNINFKELNKKVVTVSNAETIWDYLESKITPLERKNRIYKEMQELLIKEEDPF